MKTKKQLANEVKSERNARYQIAIQKTVGSFTNYSEHEGTIVFRTSNTITLAMIQALSDALGTEAINFNCGYSGEGGYSEYTPITPGSPGYIQVILPVKVLE